MPLWEFTKASENLSFDKAVIITDSNVARLYGKMFSYPQITFPAGEKSKTRDMKAKLEDELLHRGFGSDCTIIALGGGVVSDLAGFVAATFCRGVPWIAVPTTLMGMIDASIGGKTGVNTRQGKNLIGSFHMPQKTIIDVSFLQTLSPLDWKNGLAEIIKYAVTLDPSLMDIACIDEKVIKQCIALKSSVVERDPFEKEERLVLNFGHTVAHAIENCLNYEISHGEAVAIGIAWESFISMRKCHLSQDEFETIINTLVKFGFILDRSFPRIEFFQALKYDKKLGRSALIPKIGKTELHTLNQEDIEQAYEYFSHHAKHYARQSQGSSLQIAYSTCLSPCATGGR